MYASMTSSTIMTKTSSTGESYQVLETGSIVEYDYVDYAKHENLNAVGGFNTHHIYVTCQELKDKCLPIEANPREPSLSRIVKAMQDTLKDEPESFVKWNNGITIVCEEVNQHNGIVSLEFSDEDEGICNGGHTYFSIVTTNHDVSEAAVKLEVIQIPSELEGRNEEIVEIAKKRNNINNLDNYTVADFLGLYDHFKEKMEDPTLVSWHENDSDAKPYAVSAPDLIRMMTVVNPDRYNHPILSPEKTYHRSAALSKTSRHTEWFDGALDARDAGKHDPMAPFGTLIDDLFEIREMLSYSFKHDDYDSSFRKRSFYQDNIGGEGATNRDLYLGEYDGSVGYKIPATLEVMLLGMFRSDVYARVNADNEYQYIGWIINPKQIWHEEKERIVNDLSAYYDDVGKSYRDFINSEAPYRVELYEFGRKPSFPKPPAEILYDVRSGDCYVSTEGENDATHWMSNTADGLKPLHSSSPPGDEALYKFVS